VPAAEPTPRPDRQRRLFLIGAVAAALVFAVVAVLVATHAVDGLDTRIVNWFAGHQHQSLARVAEALDALDTWWLLGLILVILVGVLWWTGRMVQAVYLAITAVAAIALNPLLKQVFERPRPGTYSTVEAAAYAFPSGHTTTATAVSAALAVIAWPTRWRWPMLAAAVLFSLTMAVSRVYLGVHWPSDVVAGLAEGLAIAFTVRLLVPWPTAAESAEADGSEGSGGMDEERGIDVVFLDWGNTLMVDNGMREGPMKDWDRVEAEAGAQQALTRLRGRYRVVVATNAEDSPAIHVRLALERVGLDGLVDDVVSSADVGDRKPHYAFYRAALLHEGSAGVPLDPRRAVMVGDGTTNDVAGAQRAGLHTVWYNPTKRRFPEGAQPPDAVIRKLADLPAAVDRLAGVAPKGRSRRRQEPFVAAPEPVVSAEAATAALRAETAATQAATSAASPAPEPTARPDPAAPPDQTSNGR
jgi:membrane-associated phospholipid phosphatase/phosphoglycolate phosphatase-like HAD superfamily hydrolase